MAKLMRDKKILIILIAVILIVAGAVGYYLYKTSQEEKGIGEKPEPERVLESEPEKISELKPLDETWATYINDKLGFSIKVPKEIMHSYGSCRWVDSEKSYRPEEARVPVKIFEEEDNEVVYIASKYFYELAGETRKDYVSYFSECNKAFNSIELLELPKDGCEQSQYQHCWKIVAKDITSDKELEEFIKKRYGSGCSLGEKVTTQQKGVYDIRIKGDGKDIEFTKCPMTYGVALKYYPEKNKVISWRFGIQAPTFYKDYNLGGEYDSEMIKSFSFLGIEDETANREIYKNDEYGFSFSYPKNYQLLENARGSLLASVYIEEPIPFSLVLLQDIYMDSAQTPLISLDVLKTSKTIEQLLDHVRKVINDQAKVLEDPEAPYYGAPPPEIKSVETVTIGDLKMTKVVQDIGPGGPNPIFLGYYIAHPGYVFLLSANYGSPCSPGYCGETEKKDLPIILSTFKFIELEEVKEVSRPEEKPSITVLSPNGDEIWTIGSTYTIRWTSQNIPQADKISIHIRRIPPPPLPETGQEFDPIIFAELENTGSVNWTISDMYPAGNYIIEVNSYPSIPIIKVISDESDAPFRIESPPDETADLEIYKNDEYGYEIKYPQDWKTKERGLMSDLGHRDFVWIQSNEDEFSVDVWDFSFYSYNQLTELPPGGIDPDTIEKKEIIIDDQPAIELSYVAVGDGGLGAKRVREVFVQKNQLLYKIRSTDSKKCDQILSTFKFIK